MTAADVARLEQELAGVDSRLQDLRARHRAAEDRERALVEADDFDAMAATNAREATAALDGELAVTARRRAVLQQRLDTAAAAAEREARERELEDLIARADERRASVVYQKNRMIAGVVDGGRAALKYFSERSAFQRLCDRAHELAAELGRETPLVTSEGIDVDVSKQRAAGAAFEVVGSVVRSVEPDHIAQRTFRAHAAHYDEFAVPRQAEGVTDD